MGNVLQNSWSVLENIYNFLSFNDENWPLFTSLSPVLWSTQFTVCTAPKNESLWSICWSVVVFVQRRVSAASRAAVIHAVSHRRVGAAVKLKWPRIPGVQPADVAANVCAHTRVAETKGTLGPRRQDIKRAVRSVASMTRVQVGRGHLSRTAASLLFFSARMVFKWKKSEKCLFFYPCLEQFEQKEKKNSSYKFFIFSLVSSFSLLPCFYSWGLLKSLRLYILHHQNVSVGLDSLLPHPTFLSQAGLLRW